MRLDRNRNGERAEREAASLSHVHHLTDFVLRLVGFDFHMGLQPQTTRAQGAGERRAFAEKTDRLLYPDILDL